MPFFALLSIVAKDRSPKRPSISSCFLIIIGATKAAHAKARPPSNAGPGSPSRRPGGSFDSNRSRGRRTRQTTAPCQRAHRFTWWSPTVDARSDRRWLHVKRPGNSQALQCKIADKRTRKLPKRSCWKLSRMERLAQGARLCLHPALPEVSPGKLSTTFALF